MHHNEVFINYTENKMACKVILFTSLGIFKLHYVLVQYIAHVNVI